MTQESSSPAGGKSTSPQQRAGEFVMPPDQIPAELSAYVKQRLGVDQNGDPRRDESGQVIKPGVVPAKEHGSYKGTIILNNADYLVQAVGKDQRTAVVHRKADVELVGSKLAWRDQNQRMHGADVQIHYSGSTAKAYPWDRDRALAASTQSKDAPSPHAVEKALKPETLIAQAQQYAAENIKSPKSREAFLRHLEAVTQKVTQPEQTSRSAAPATPEQSKKADQGIDR